MLKMPRNNSDIKEWNSYLERKYKFGIWEFTFCLSDIIRKSKLEYEYPPKTEFAKASIIGIRKFKKREIRKLSNLKRYVIKKLFESYRDVGFWDDEKPDKHHEKILIENYKLLPFFTTIDKEIEAWKREPFLNIRGRPIESKHIITSTWAQIIKDKRGANWEVIEHLFRWFFVNLKGTNYREELGKIDKKGIPKIDQFTFRNEYYILKRNPKTKRYFEILQEIYFRKPRFFPFIRIEFKEKYIDFNLIKEHNPHKPSIKFPNGISFP